MPSRPSPARLDPARAAQLARATAAFRFLIGVVAVVAPRLSGRLLFHDASLPASSVVVMRMFGIRDAALGLGALLAARRSPSAVRGWVEAGALCDAGDVMAMTVDRGATIRRPVRVATIAAATSATVSAPVLARALTPQSAGTDPG